MPASQDWFPGQDFPDREIWLKARAPRKSKKARVIKHPSMGTLRLGINAAKRALDAKKPAKRGGRKELILQRQAYYRRSEP